MKMINFDSKWVSRIAALVCAVVFWLFVLASENPDVYTSVRDLPVTFVGIQQLASQNLTMTSGAQSFVDLRLTGKLDRMYLLNEDAVAVTVDLSSILAPGEYHLSYSVDPGVAGVEATKQTEYITVTVERVVTRTFPVELKITQQPDENYTCSEISLSTDVLEISGPESVVDKVRSVQASFSFAGVRTSGTKTLEYRILDENGQVYVSDELHTNVASLHLDYVIQQTKQVPFTVEIASTDLIGTDRISYTVSPAKLQMSGLPSYLSGINEIKLGSLKLMDLLQQGLLVDNKITLTLPVSVPNNVICENAPEQVQVTIELQGIEQKTVLIPAEYFVPVSGMRYLTESLGVTVLGTAPELAATTPVTLLVTPLAEADELPAGTNTVLVRVDADRSVTVLGTYTVDVLVQEAVIG